MRHCAWLNAVPEKIEGDKSTTKEVMRREAYKRKQQLAADQELEMPPCGARYLVGYLFEIGPTESIGMGAAPLSHRELEAWQHNTGIALSAWEVRTLKRLSADYLGEAQQATARDRPPPWKEAPYAQTVPNLQAEALRASLRALAAP